MKSDGDRGTGGTKLSQRLRYGLPLLPILWAASPFHTCAQLIIPANDGTGTQLIQDTQQITINGGQRSSNGRNLFHSFTEFGLIQGQTATFLSTPSIQTILTRVTGGNVSFIDGAMQVVGGNSNLVFMNPAGIVFGPNARLDVPAAFLATTANRIGLDSNFWWDATEPNAYDQLNGSPTEFVWTANTPGAIANLGHLSVSAGQSLTLLAGSILHQGQLFAPGGQVTLLSVPGRHRVRLSQPGSLLSLEIQPFASGAPAVSIGADLGLSLPQLLTGGNLASASQVSVNPDGTLRLSGSTAIIPAPPGTTLVSGQISVRSEASGLPGAVNVLGQNIALINARVDASGWVGGTVRIGGEVRGQGAVPPARMTTIDPGSLITANSLAIAAPGNGGRVVIWADETTRFYGTIQAQGGRDGGAGGFVEVSGRQQLIYRGQTDITAPNGPGGTLLLDPTNIVIVPGTNAPNDFELFADGQIFANEGGNLLTISAEALESATGNVILEATNNITVLLSSLDDLFFSSGALSVTFNADTDRDGVGNFFSPPGVPLLTSPTAKTDLTIRGANITVGNIDTSVVVGDGGDVTLTANQDLQVGEINTRSRGNGGQSGTVTLQSQQGQITTGNIVTEATGLNGGGGKITLTSDRGDITTGSLLSRASGSSGTVQLSALAPTSNIRFASIDTASPTGIGGDVVLAAGRFVQGTEVIPRLNRPTIDTAGAIASGTVLIRHGGGGLRVPFVVGDRSPNGTVGAIDTRRENLIPPPVLTFQGSYRSPLQTIRILTLDLLPEIPLRDPQPLQPRPTPVPVTLAATLEPPRVTLPLPTLASREQPLATLPEESVTAAFQAYLKLPERPNFWLNPTATLQQIQAQTGVKSALVYLNFVPANVATVDPVNPLDLHATVAFQPTMVAWNFPPFAAFSVPDTELPKSSQASPQPTDRQFRERPVNLPVASQRANDQLEIVVVTGAGRPFRKLVAGVTRDRVRAGVKQFLNEVTDPRKTQTRTYLAPSQQLYRWLIRPMEAELSAQGITNLAFIADAGLRFIPFAALHDGQQFLIQKFSLGLMPSLSLTDTRFTPLQQARVLAMGASEFMHQAPLPAVPTELALITQQLRTGRSFLNQEFTLPNLQGQRQQEAFQIVHLATHGEFQAGDLSRSYIQLWDTQLRLDQLRQLGWQQPPVELLVLSACRTALGSEEAELGFAGFAVQAGVKSALASLWNVSDEGTLGLMTEFYRQLAIAPIRADALRRAQIALLEGRIRLEQGRLQDALHPDIPLPPVLSQLGSRNLQHPYYWSAFTMIGSPW